MVKKKIKQEIKLENLVVLKFAHNNCYTSVISVDDAKKEFESFDIDVEKQKWLYHCFDGSTGYNAPRLNKYDIGGKRYIKDSCGKHGIIGVYDRTNIEHLNSMSSAVRESTSPRKSGMMNVDDW